MKSCFVKQPLMACLYFILYLENSFFCWTLKFHPVVMDMLSHANVFFCEPRTLIMMHYWVWHMLDARNMYHFGILLCICLPCWYVMIMAVQHGSSCSCAFIFESMLVRTAKSCDKGFISVVFMHQIILPSMNNAALIAFWIIHI